VPEFIHPVFRENKPKSLVFSHRKRAFSACFRENRVYKFGHGRACRKSSLPEELAGHQKYIRTGLDLLHFRMVPAHQPVKQGEQTTVIFGLQSKGAEKKSFFHACSNIQGTGNAHVMRFRSPIHIKVKSRIRALNKVNISRAVDAQNGDIYDIGRLQWRHAGSK
jgi:hypothetical protein